MSNAVKPDIIGLTASIATWAIKLIKGRGVQEVIVAVHLQNKEGARPVLRKKHKTDIGIDYVFTLPAGVDQGDFEKNRHYFESYLNCIVEIEATGRKLILKTHKSEYPTKIKFNFDPSLY